MAPEPSGKKENLSEAGKKEGARYKRDLFVQFYVFSNGDRFSSENFFFRDALRISMFWIFYWISYNSSIALCLLKD